MSKKKPSTGWSGVVQVVVSLAFVALAAAGAGHNGVLSPRPPTGCVQLQIFSGSS